MKYALVLFTEEKDSPGIIATNWINYEEEKCWSWFPPVKSEFLKNKIIIARKYPQSDWLQCPIRILREFGKFFVPHL